MYPGRAMAGEPVKVRNRWSIRPFQHVLEPLFAYLLIAKRQYEDGKYAGYYNVGPSDEDCITTGELTELFCRAWGKGQTWISQSQDGPPRGFFPETGLFQDAAGIWLEAPLEY